MKISSFAPILLLLLVQSLYAAEFPGLGYRIGIGMNGTDVSGLLWTYDTVSVNGEVPVFTVCARFKSDKKDIGCQIQGTRVSKSGSFTSSVSTVTYGTAKYLSEAKDDSGYDVTCMAYPNPISDFITYFNGVSAGTHDWKVVYICPATSPLPAIIAGLAVVAFAVFGFCAWKIYQNKKTRELVQQNTLNNTSADFYGNAGGAYESPAAYGNGNPTYGQPTTNGARF